MAADSLYLDQIAAFLTTVKVRAADGITVADLAQTVVDGLRLSIKLLDLVTGMTGEEKKAEALKLAAFLFDAYADLCVPLLARPVWWIVKPAVRLLVMQVASGAIEALLPMVRGAA